MKNELNNLHVHEDTWALYGHSSKVETYIYIYSWVVNMLGLSLSRNHLIDILHETGLCIQNVDTIAGSTRKHNWESLR
jgi:hypothetical protein